MKRLNQYIERQKQIEHSPFLAEQILAQTQKVEPLRRRSAIMWQSAVVAASVVVVVLLGITLGGSSKPTARLAINDRYIENFSILTLDENE